VTLILFNKELFLKSEIVEGITFNPVTIIPNKKAPGKELV
jgi:hypothetical protein